MSGIIVALAVVFFVHFIFGKKKKKSKTPECYHCESKDTLNFNDKADTFYCNFCGRIIDYDYIMTFHPKDYSMLKNDKENYESFKQTRREESEKNEKHSIANNKDIKG